MKGISGRIQEANSRYYSSKGGSIYSDFSTFAEGKALANCNAIEFVRDFLETEGEITVCEYGIGNGNFAKVFLDGVKKLSPALYLRTKYHLFDISERMIGAAKKTLFAHSERCAFRRFDAAFEEPFLEFDYCRINELLSDLPAEIYQRKGQRIFTEDMLEVPSPRKSVVKFLERVEQGRFVPFSLETERFVSALCRLGKEGFRVDIFDYGFYSAEDMLLLPVEEWNRLVVRKYGAQITVDLNFLELCSVLAAQEFSVVVERQKEYCEKALGARLRLKESDECLDYVVKKKDDGIEEDDGFYHMGIGEGRP